LLVLLSFLPFPHSIGITLLVYLQYIPVCSLHSPLLLIYRELSSQWPFLSYQKWMFLFDSLKMSMFSPILLVKRMSQLKTLCIFVEVILLLNFLVHSIYHLFQVRFFP
jgi:hypothetical protein